MPVAVLQPQAKQPKADPLDTVLKAVQIAASVYGIKSDISKQGLIEKQGQAEDFKLQQAKDAADPNGPGSTAFKKALEAQGIKGADAMSEDQMKTFSPIAVAVMKEKNSAHDLAIKQAEKNDIETEKKFTQMAQELDPNRARTGNFGKYQMKVAAAQSLDALFDQYPDNNIPKAQTAELANGVAALINNGSAQSQHQINAIVPDSLAGNANAIAGWFMNNPQGLEQQEFVKAMKESNAREKQVAIDQMDSAKIQKLAAWSPLYKKDPARYAQIIETSGLDPEMIDERGLYKKNAKAANKSGVMGGNSFGITPEQAQAELIRRNGLKATIQQLTPSFGQQPQGGIPAALQPTRNGG